MKRQLDSLIKKGMWVAIIVMLGRCWLSRADFPQNMNAYTLFSFASESISVTAIFVVLYEKWLWRFIPFQKVPYIAGNYSGTLHSNFDGQTHNAQLCITQTYLSISITLVTNESRSRSVSASIEDVLGEPTLIYTYLNEPQIEQRSNSAIHYGTATFHHEKPVTIRGKYYTDRNTAGDMVFTKNT